MFSKPIITNYNSQWVKINNIQKVPISLKIKSLCVLKCHKNQLSLIKKYANNDRKIVPGKRARGAQCTKRV